MDALLALFTRLIQLKLPENSPPFVWPSISRHTATASEQIFQLIVDYKRFVRGTDRVFDAASVDDGDGFAYAGTGVATSDHSELKAAKAYLTQPDLEVEFRLGIIFYVEDSSKTSRVNTRYSNGTLGMNVVHPDRVLKLVRFNSSVLQEQLGNVREILDKMTKFGLRCKCPVTNDFVPITSSNHDVKIDKYGEELRAIRNGAGEIVSLQKKSSLVGPGYIISMNNEPRQCGPDIRVSVKTETKMETKDFDENKMTKTQTREKKGAMRTRIGAWYVDIAPVNIVELDKDPVEFSKAYEVEIENCKYSNDQVVQACKRDGCSVKDLFRRVLDQGLVLAAFISNVCMDCK